MTNPDLDP
jgi:alpha-glucosidase (family GH31 glycosyl hydrolase)